MQKENDLKFGVFVCHLPYVRFSPAIHQVVVLAVDMQAALSTVPGAVKIERLDGYGNHVIINKAVLAMFMERAGKRKKKE